MALPQRIGDKERSESRKILRSAETSAGLPEVETIESGRSEDNQKRIRIEYRVRKVAGEAGLGQARSIWNGGVVIGC